MTPDREEELSMALIKKLEEEESLLREKEEKKRKEKMNEEESNNICKICLDTLLSSNVHPLECCDHVFHEDCLKEYVKSEVEFNLCYIYCKRKF